MQLNRLVTLSVSYTRLSLADSVHLESLREIQIEDALVKVAGAKDNLCLFACVYNSMRSKAARFAMAGGNVNNPTARFVEIAQQNSRSLDRSVEGYTSNDMGNYLQWLKHVKLIRGYKWKACREGMLENVLLRPTKFQSPNTACIFFGATTPTDCRDLMKKKLGWFERSTKKENWGEKRRSKELIQYYEANLAKSMKQRSQDSDLAHGVAV